MTNNPSQNPSKTVSPMQDKPATPSVQPPVHEPAKPVQAPPANAPATKS
jgi:hypothetical protein